jgi:hypothetical protein
VLVPTTNVSQLFSAAVTSTESTVKYYTVKNTRVKSLSPLENYTQCAVEEMERVHKNRQLA